MNSDEHMKKRSRIQKSTIDGFIPLTKDNDESQNDETTYEKNETLKNIKKEKYKTLIQNRKQILVSMTNYYKITKVEIYCYK